MCYPRTFLFALLFLGGFVSCRTTEPPEGGQPDFSAYYQYDTYAFGRINPSERKNPLNTWPQLEGRIKRELNFSLPSINFSFISDDPELLIYFYVLAPEAQEPPVLRYQIGLAAGRFFEEGEYFDNYGPNTLVLDFVDARKNELIWRGSAHISFEDPETAYEQLPERIRSLVKRYPYTKSREE